MPINVKDDEKIKLGLRVDFNKEKKANYKNEESCWLTPKALDFFWGVNFK